MAGEETGQGLSLPQGNGEGSTCRGVAMLLFSVAGSREGDRVCRSCAEGKGRGRDVTGAGGSGRGEGVAGAMRHKEMALACNPPHTLINAITQTCSSPLGDNSAKKNYE